MSIDARVQTVIINEDGSGELRLIDRPARSGQTPGIAGQRSLAFDSAPENVDVLRGCDIWGGDGEIILGDCRIATRVGYTYIEFEDAGAFKTAVTKYRNTEGEAMLCLSRMVGQKIVVNNGALILTILDVRGDRVRLGFEADESVTIDREEIHNAKIREANGGQP